MISGGWALESQAKQVAAMIAIATHHNRLEARDREDTARLLVIARGYHGAVDACLRNGWEEILTLLLATRQPA